MTGKGSDSGSNSSNGGGSGNNSDNSGLVSLGNTSFGFNFDSEEGMINNSPRNSNTSEEGDSDTKPAAFPTRRGARSVGAAAAAATPPAVAVGAAQKPSVTASRKGPVAPSSTTMVPEQKAAAASVPTPPVQVAVAQAVNAPVAPQPAPPPPPSQARHASHHEAAAAAVANLQTIASECSARPGDADSKQSLKRKSPEGGADNDSGGYNSDDEGRDADGTSQMQSSVKDEDDDATDTDCEKVSQKGPRKKKKLDDLKREERNAREKERSFRISKQINELRNLLSSGGVIVPKGTKSSVLTEAANYIRMLQQHQYRSEIDRHQLVQQIQMIGGGALGQQAATAVRHVAAQNGVWSLGNFGGVPPKSAMMYHQPGVPGSAVPGDAGSDPNIQPTAQQQAMQDGSVLPNKIEEPDYRYIFNSCTVGMAVASMGGAFIDCNKLFCQLSNYTKQEICSMTIFNLTARQDLQHAFDLISQMLSAPADASGNSSSGTCKLRGSLKHRSDLGLSVTLIKGSDGVAKCFCVTLVMNPTSPFDTARPIPATSDHVQTGQALQAKDASTGGLDPTPAYTAG